MREEEYIPTVLIVDDMAANIAILSDLLQSSYKIKIAKSGQRALEIAKSKEKPDLILLDIEMPQMSGYDVCKILKSSSETRNIPIIFVTAKNDTTDEEYGLNLGAIDYIKKPFHPAIIKIRVKNHMDLKLKSDKLEELSMIDSLTNIPNRRFFNETFEKKYREILRDKRSLALIMIDVDFFKLYNDNYGHWQGDECLRKVAQTLRKNLK
ncbi:MAG: diguanylate cyclase response regulator, partial [Sulfurimonas sp. RIFOXYD12_FULL_36_11]